MLDMTGGRKGVRGDGSVHVFDDEELDVVTSVFEVRTTPGDLGVACAGKPGVFAAVTLEYYILQETSRNFKKLQETSLTVTFVTRLPNLFITEGTWTREDMMDGSVMTGMPKSAISSRS